MALIRQFNALLILQTLVGLVLAQYPSVWKPSDVITYFCSRWYHQSVVKNDVLYVYGGVQTFQLPNVTVRSTNNTLGYNPFLLQVDLKKSWDWTKNMSWLAFETTPNPRTGSVVRPGMVGGAMYHGPYNDTRVWTYSGTSYRGNESFLAANSTYNNQYPLWSFDNSTQVWDQFDVGQLKTPSYGSSAEASDQGLAFYLSGGTDNGTEPYTRDDLDQVVLLNGMMVVDTSHQTAKNISVSSMKDAQPRLGGALQYVPGIGGNGLLVALGGKVYDGQRIASSQDKGRLLTFDTVDVLDLASYLTSSKSNGTWYSQTTSGDIPPARIDSCAVIATAPDNSTHNIYIYGGWDPTGGHTKWYDDIYVLSLPSYTWIKIYQAESPRYGHTCHIVGRQLLTIGGDNVRRNTTGTCDWETESIAIFDLPTVTWGSVFNASAGRYELSKSLVDKVGGTPQGGAPRKSPEKGWASPEFEALMNTTRIYSNLNGTLQVIRPPTSNGNTGPSPSTRTAIIAGVTVTVVVLLLCIIWLIHLRRRRRSLPSCSELATDSTSIAEIEERPKFELSPDEKKIYEMTGSEMRHESPDTAVTAEADRFNVVTRAVELPATNFGEHGRWGIPIIKIPTPSASRRGSAVAGLAKLGASRRGSCKDMV
ncbi:hypothetical protein CC86DRAFT_24973 [Ophiobolus disseminans]|uniref:Galactose oxidase n=1 Tax=Ophiobolus disseminans TaxID=1469910 RepID=A0A6A7A006_9PLEO|nr:hypothetical protein CC86DRAFT_24973 [Ophiobolus disseminans]